MSSFDAWLEKPYDDAARDEAAFEHFQQVYEDSDEFWDAFRDWARENYENQVPQAQPWLGSLVGSVDAFCQSSTYHEAVEKLLTEWAGSKE